MRRIPLFASILILAACSTLEPAERTARIPNIPVEKRDCESPLGLIPDGGAVQGYLNEFEPVGRSCQTGELVCHDGVWSGEYVHPKCTPGAGAPES
jgi:hypothetical protein